MDSREERERDRQRGWQDEGGRARGGEPGRGSGWGRQRAYAEPYGEGQQYDPDRGRGSRHAGQGQDEWSEPSGWADYGPGERSRRDERERPEYHAREDYGWSRSESDRSARQRYPGGGEDRSAWADRGGRDERGGWDQRAGWESERAGRGVGYSGRAYGGAAGYEGLGYRRPPRGGYSEPDYSSRPYGSQHEPSRYGESERHRQPSERYGEDQWSRAWERGSGQDRGEHGAQYGGAQYGGGRYGGERFGGEQYGGERYGAEQYGRGEYGSGQYGAHSAQGTGRYSASQSAARRGPKGYKRSDSRIEEDINDRLFQTEHVDSREVHVQVKEGKVTLSGTVRERWMKHEIEDIAAQCPGVQDVENDIRVARETEGSQTQTTRHGTAQLGGNAVPHGGQQTTVGGAAESFGRTGGITSASGSSSSTTASTGPAGSTGATNPGSPTSGGAGSASSAASGAGDKGKREPGNR